MIDTRVFWKRHPRLRALFISGPLLIAVSPTFYQAYNVLSRPNPMRFNWGTVSIPGKWLVVRSNPNLVAAANPCWVVIIACSPKVVATIGRTGDERSKEPTVSWEEFENKLQGLYNNAKLKRLATEAGEWICFEIQGSLERLEDIDPRSAGAICFSLDHAIVPRLHGDPIEYAGDFYEIVRTIRSHN